MKEKLGNKTIVSAIIALLTILMAAFVGSQEASVTVPPGAQATDLVVNADGTGDIELAGTVVKQDLELKGTGDYEASNLESLETTIRIDGTSKAKLWVIESLDVVINGTGGVSYFGSPNVTQSITGSGSITSLGDK